VEQVLVLPLFKERLCIYGGVRLQRTYMFHDRYGEYNSRAPNLLVAKTEASSPRQKATQPYSDLSCAILTRITSSC